MGNRSSLIARHRRLALIAGTLLLTGCAAYGPDGYPYPGYAYPGYSYYAPYEYPSDSPYWGFGGAWGGGWAERDHDHWRDHDGWRGERERDHGSTSASVPHAAPSGRAASSRQATPTPQAASRNAAPPARQQPVSRSTSSYSASDQQRQER